MTKQELLAEFNQKFNDGLFIPHRSGDFDYAFDEVKAFLLKAFDAGVEAALKEAATVAGNTGDVSNNSMNIVRAIRKITL